MGPFANPELVRNVRAQLRWGRMLSAAVICGILSLVVGYAMAHNAPDPERWGVQFLRTVVSAQVFLLLIIGGLACLQAIQREKDLNTFDFQRITRLGALELAAGKLFGAPIFAYFIALCLVPAAVAGAVAGRAHVSFVLVSYAIVLLGTIGFHALALLLSLLVDRSSAIATVLVLLFIVLGMPVTAVRLFLNLGTLTPSYAADLITSRTWAVGNAFAPAGWRRYFIPPSADAFFGWPVHHAFVLLALYATFTGWCLLALARNIKRDPAVYELFTPSQALGFVAYINIIVFGFFDWRRFGPAEAQAVLLGINASLFLGFGLLLLRNRDRVRRLREGRVEPAWVVRTWPAPYLLPGTLLAGLATVGIVELMQNPADGWTSWLGIFLVRVAMVAAWVLRDILYLQWRNLARGRRPLLVGLLYLAIFYVCVAIVSGSLGLLSTPEGTAYVAIFAPSTVLGLTPRLWAGASGVWIAGLCVQLLAAGMFVSLQRRQQLELSPHPPAAAVPA